MVLVVTEIIVKILLTHVQLIKEIVNFIKRNGICFGLNKGIASAPDLLEACKLAVENKFEPDKWRTKMQQAIQKAEGDITWVKKEYNMRVKLCEEIAYMWRDAETLYLESDYQDSYYKDEVREYADKCQLTEEENKLVEDIANSMGV